MLCPNLNSLSVHSLKGLILLSCKMKLQSGRNSSLVIKYVLWDDVNAWHGKAKSVLHTSYDSLKW